MSRKRILVVEDNEDNRRILLYRLRKIGDFDIVETANGAEAVAAVESNPPDLIFMDLKMPVMDGWEATRRIRALDAGRAIPIIALTAQAMAGDEQKAQQFVRRAFEPGQRQADQQPADAVDEQRAERKSGPAGVEPQPGAPARQRPDGGTGGHRQHLRAERHRAHPCGPALRASMPQRASAASSLTRASTQRAPSGVVSFFQNGACVFR